jgi:alcohol dehydrogenase (cytochrome c)
MATLDTHLVALDAKTGNTIWDVTVDDYKTGYSITLAPLAVDGKVFVGVTSGECGLKGFLDAYDAKTGERLWRFWTIPEEGDPARKTWAGNSAEFGGSPTWLTGNYDADSKTLYWGVGNPAPDYDGTVREGDNLYSDSIIALDADTGKLKWYFQHTPHDTHDWDSNQDMILIDAEWKGKPRKLVIQANRNGFYYVLDRVTGEFLLGRAYIAQTWADGLDAKGRPIVIPNTDPTEEGKHVCPDALGGTNWSAPSFSPDTGLFYFLLRDSCATYTYKTKTPIAGRPYTGTGQQVDPSDAGQPGAIAALDPLTGDLRWRFDMHEAQATVGVLATKGGLVFGGTYRGHLLALDAKTGKLLWRKQLGSTYRSSPISYAIVGRQYIAIAAESVLYTFRLP